MLHNFDTIIVIAVVIAIVVDVIVIIAFLQGVIIITHS